MNTIRSRKFWLHTLRTSIKIHILKNVKNGILLLREYLCKLDFSIILFAKHLPAAAIEHNISWDAMTHNNMWTILFLAATQCIFI